MRLFRLRLESFAGDVAVLDMQMKGVGDEVRLIRFLDLMGALRTSLCARLRSSSESLLFGGVHLR